MRAHGVLAVLIAIGLTPRDGAAQAAWGAAAKNATPPAPPPPNAMTGESSGSSSSTSKSKYNNEGTFKVSGAKGTGTVGGTKGKKPQTTASSGTPKKKAANAMIAQWPGFRLTDDGGSELMVEFSQNPAAPTEHKAAGTITYVFKGAHVIKSNNQNPLITVHFNTPVASAKLVPKKDELHLVVDMRAGASAAPTFGLRASSDGDGQQFFVKFPSGAYLPAGAENEPMPPPPTQKIKAKGDDKKTAPPKTDSGAKTGPNP